MNNQKETGSKQFYKNIPPLQECEMIHGIFTKINLGWKKFITIPRIKEQFHYFEGIDPNGDYFLFHPKLGILLSAPTRRELNLKPEESAFIFQYDPYVSLFILPIWSRL